MVTSLLARCPLQTRSSPYSFTLLHQTYRSGCPLSLANADLYVIRLPCPCPQYRYRVLTVCISQQPDEYSDDQNTSPPQRRKLTEKAQTQVQRRGGESSTQGARRNQRTASPDEAEEEDLNTDDDNGETSPRIIWGGYYNGNLWGCVGDTNKDRLVKKFVRLALASEYTRQPLKRTDITNKGSPIPRLWRD